MEDALCWRERDGRSIVFGFQLFDWTGGCMWHPFLTLFILIWHFFFLKKINEEKEKERCSSLNCRKWGETRRKCIWNFKWFFFSSWRGFKRWYGKVEHQTHFVGMRSINLGNWLKPIRCVFFPHSTGEEKRLRIHEPSKTLKQQHSRRHFLLILVRSFFFFQLIFIFFKFLLYTSIDCTTKLCSSRFFVFVLDRFLFPPFLLRAW